jgi:hypothetical protein
MIFFRRRALILTITSIICASAWACSGGDDDKPTCPKENPECKELATVESGKEAVEKRGCPTCHGQNMAGANQPLPNQAPTALGEPVELFPPNLTADTATGVAPPDKGGKWTDDALALAIRKGIDVDSQALCPQMKHFSEMTDFEVYSIVKYLRSIPAVSNKVPRSVCPPTKTKDQQNQ